MEAMAAETLMRCETGLLRPAWGGGAHEQSPATVARAGWSLLPSEHEKRLFGGLGVGSTVA